MNSTAIELYIYMSSSEPIIKWLEEEGVETKNQALDKLKPYVKSNVLTSFMTQGSSLAGTANCVEKVIKHFENKEKQTK